MNTLADLMLIALATWQIVEIGHHALISKPLRQKAIRWAETTERVAAADWYSWLARGYLCPACWSVWVALALALLVRFPLSRPLVYWFVLGLAAVRLAQLGNDLSYAYCRTIKHETEEPDASEIFAAQTCSSGEALPPVGTTAPTG